MEIDYYHSGNWFLPPRKLIITTGEIDFYHHRIGKLMFGFIWLHYYNHPQQEIDAMFKGYFQFIFIRQIL